MAVENPYSITYGSFTVGGDSDKYLLDGVTSLALDYNQLSIAFDVIVVSKDDEISADSEALIAAFTKRDQSIQLNYGDEVVVYANGGDGVLNPVAGITKPGDDIVDRPNSRRYSVTITGDRPAEDNDALRDLRVGVNTTASGQRFVVITGTYTATSTYVKATLAYKGLIDTEQAAYLTAVDPTATFELTNQNYDHDRNDLTCTFTRSFTEKLFSDTESALDDPAIRDHIVIFTETAQHSDQSRPTYTLRRCSANYQCAIDDTALDLRDAYKDKVIPHLTGLFEANYNPSIYGVESSAWSVDETSRTIDVTMGFIFQSPNGGSRISVQESVAYSERRQVDNIPLHLQDELAADVEPGWAELRRIAQRTVQIVGTESPKRRLGQRPDSGPAGSIRGIEGGPNVKRSGWNIISSDSEVSRSYYGDPDFDLILTSILTETVVEQFTKEVTPR